MINLANKDIKHTLGKFVVTAMGVGMLLGIVLIMMGLYKGMMVDAEILLQDLDADLWVVQEHTLGPFAQGSRVHEDLKESLISVEGIKSAEAMTFQTIQMPSANKPIRVMILGFDPFGSVHPVRSNRLIAGRDLKSDHYEMVVTDKTGYKLHQKIEIGRDLYTVVGITHGTVSSGGDPLVYLSLKDAQNLQFLYSNKEIENNRARGISSGESHMVNTIIASVKKGYSIKKIAQEIKIWYHKNVFTRAEQKKILTKNLIEKASKQIGLFTIILVGVSTIIIALIIYTMTLEKMKEISIMKLVGLPNRTIIMMIIQETLILGILAFVFGNIFSHMIYEKFPKRIVLDLADAWLLFLIVVAASILASFIGVRQVIKADPAAAIGD